MTRSALQNQVINIPRSTVLQPRQVTPLLPRKTVTVRQAVVTPTGITTVPSIQPVRGVLQPRNITPITSQVFDKVVAGQGKGVQPGEGRGSSSITSMLLPFGLGILIGKFIL